MLGKKHAIQEKLKNSWFIQNNNLFFASLLDKLPSSFLTE